MALGIFKELDDEILIGVRDSIGDALNNGEDPTIAAASASGQGISLTLIQRMDFRDFMDELNYSLALRGLSRCVEISDTLQRFPQRSIR